MNKIKPIIRTMLIGAVLCLAAADDAGPAQPLAADAADLVTTLSGTQTNQQSIEAFIDATRCLAWARQHGNTTALLLASAAGDDCAGFVASAVAARVDAEHDSVYWYSYLISTPASNESPLVVHSADQLRKRLHAQRQSVDVLLTGSWTLALRRCSQPRSALIASTLVQECDLSALLDIDHMRRCASDTSALLVEEALHRPPLVDHADKVAALLTMLRDETPLGMVIYLRNYAPTAEDRSNFLRCLADRLPTLDRASRRMIVAAQRQFLTSCDLTDPRLSREGTEIIIDILQRLPQPKQSQPPQQSP